MESTRGGRQHLRIQCRTPTREDPAGRRQERSGHSTSTSMKSVSTSLIPGASGTGKTTTLMRLAEGALANGFAVVIVDCKGDGPRATRRLAERHPCPFTLVDPDDPRRSATTPARANRRTSPTSSSVHSTFGGEAEIYKQIAMEVMPVIVRALQSQATAGSALERITHALAKGGLSRLGRARRRAIPRPSGAARRQQAESPPRDTPDSSGPRRADAGQVRRHFQ